MHCEVDVIHHIYRLTSQQADRRVSGNSSDAKERVWERACKVARNIDVRITVSVSTCTTVYKSLLHSNTKFEKKYEELLI